MTQARPKPNASAAPTRRKRYPTVSPYGRVTPTRMNHQKRGLVVLDGNSPEAHFLRRAQKQLREQLGGGDLTPAQLALISHIAWTELRILILRKKAIEGRETPYDSHIELAHINAIKRLYAVLGIKHPGPKFSDLLK